MNETQPTHIQDWIDRIAASFRAFETYEVVVFDDRDAGAMRWVIDCLLNPESKTAGDVLEKIVAERQRRINDDGTERA